MEDTVAWGVGSVAGELALAIGNMVSGGVSIVATWQRYSRGMPRPDQSLLSGETALRLGKSSSQNSVTPRGPGAAVPP